MKFLITGATGFLGSHITEQLAREGHTVRVLARRKSDRSFLRSLEIEEALGDITQPDTLPAAVAGVDAVVHAPFGAYPGTCQGYYGSDTAHVIECFAAVSRDTVAQYAEKWISPFATDQEMLDKLVGEEKLSQLRANETITEGYRP